MYPEEICKPMREDLTSVGFVEMKNPDEVSSILDKSEGTVLVMVNSVCGCAAGNARPAVKMSTSFQKTCLLYTSPSPRDGLLSRMPSSA